MDKNTVIGLVLILGIFVGFSIYNNKRTEKIFKTEVAFADSLYSAGDYTKARDAYLVALGYRPKDQATMAKVAELNGKLGLNEQAQQPVQGAAGDTLKSVTAVRRKKAV